MIVQTKANGTDFKAPHNQLYERMMSLTTILVASIISTLSSCGFPQRTQLCISVRVIIIIISISFFNFCRHHCIPFIIFKVSCNSAHLCGGTLALYMKAQKAHLLRPISPKPRGNPPQCLPTCSW